MACREFFEALPTGKDASQRADLIDKAHPAACCEAESVSSHSKGTIGDDEFAIRYIFSPIHLEEDGTVTAAAFSDVKDKGLSCERSQTQIAPPVLHERGAAQAQSYNEDKANEGKPRRTYVGTVQVKAAAVRELLCEVSKVRAFGVYDTALPENVDHMDIFQVLTGPSRPGQSRLRKKLRDTFLEGGFHPKPTGPAAQ